MNTASKHLKRYPNARASTLAYLEKRDAKVQQLRMEMKSKRPSLRELWQGVVDACRSFGRNEP